MIYSQNKRSYVMGMSWSDQGGNIGEAKSFAKRERRPYVIVPTHDATGERVFAVGIHGGNEAIKGRTFSAALALGLVEPNAVICQALADNTVWFSVLRAGAPIAGEDRVVSAEESDDFLRQHLGMADCVIGDVTGAKYPLNTAFDEFEQRIADGRINKEQLKAIQIALPTTTTQLALQASLVLSLVAALGVGWWVYDRHLSSEKARKAALSQVTKSQEEAARLEAQRKAAIETYNRQVAEKRAEIERALGGPMAQWQAWESVRRSLPRSVNGYEPDSMECTPAKCTVNWRASGPTVRFVDKAALPGWVEDYEPGLTARSEFVLQPVTSTTATLRAEDAPKLRLAIAQTLQFVTDSSIGAPQPAAFTPPAQPPDTGLQPVNLGFTGDLRMAGAGASGLLKLNQAMQAVKHAPIALKSIRWSQLSTSAPGAEVDGYWAFSMADGQAK